MEPLNLNVNVNLKRFYVMTFFPYLVAFLKDLEALSLKICALRKMRKYGSAVKRDPYMRMCMHKKCMLWI